MKWNIPFLMTGHEDVNDHVAMFHFSYLHCLNILCISSCMWVLCIFKIRLLLFFIFFPQKSQLLARECGSSVSCLSGLLRKGPAQGQDAVVACHFSRPHIPRLLLHVSMPGNYVTVQVNFNSVLVLPLDWKVKEQEIKAF